MDKVTTQKLNEYSSKTGKDIATLTASLNSHVADLKKTYPGKDELWYEVAARNKLYADLKSELRSPAVPCDVTILGFSAMRDINASVINTAKKTFLDSPSDAIKQGVTDQDGNPIDNREFLADGTTVNRFKGRKIEPLNMRTIITIGKPVSEGKVNMFLISAAGDSAETIPTPGASYRIRVNVKSKDPYYTGNLGRSSIYTPIEQPIKGDIIDILREAPDAIRVPNLKALDAWHEKNKNNARRVAIVEGNLMFKKAEPTAYGSYLMILEDEGDFEGDGVTCWVHDDLVKNIDWDLGRGSQLIVLARTDLGAGWNKETREQDNSVKRVMLNISGLFPVVKMAPDEEGSM